MTHAGLTVSQFPRSTTKCLKQSNKAESDLLKKKKKVILGQFLQIILQESCHSLKSKFCTAN